MTILVTHAVALVLGFGLAVVAFVVFNIKNPAAVDKVEDVVRKAGA